MLAALCLPVGAWAQPVVWTTPSLVRTGKTDAAGTGTQAMISAGRGEYESFQIAIQAPAGGLTNVNITVSALSGPGGATIPQSSFSLFREQYVYVSKSSPDWEGSNRPLGVGWYPDGLIPFNDPATGKPITGAAIEAVPFNLSAANNQPIWVDVLVPRNATPGQYAGTWTVTSDQGNASGTVALTVWNFTLPLAPSMKSAFLFWNASSLASDQELLRNRIAPLHTDTSIQSSLMANYGLSTVGLSYWSGADYSICTMSAAPSVADLKAAAAAQQPGLTQLIYSADEISSCPSLNAPLKQWAQNMHQAGIKNLVTMAPDPLLFDDGSGSGQSAVDIWTVLPVAWDGAASNIAAAIAKGDSIWSYNALVQDSYSPKWQIDFDPINFRIQPGFISNSLGITGLLYWKVDGWSSDPWNQVNNTGTFSAGNYPGEGMLVYPGDQVGIQGVAPSMRLKWLRDGVEDYEYLQLLKAQGYQPIAQEKSAEVGANWSTWTKDANVLLSVRDEIGSQLDRLNTPVATTTYSSGTTSGDSGSQGTSDPTTTTTTTTTSNQPASDPPATTTTSAPPASTPPPVAAAPPPTSAPPLPPACIASTLSLTVSQPTASATVESGSPQSIRLQIVNNCGDAFTGGNVLVSFSSGDTAVSLTDQDDGGWTGNWTPVQVASPVTLSFAANGGNASGAAQVSVTVQPNSHSTNAALVVNSASGSNAAPQVVAPGSYVTIWGTNLAGQSQAAATSVPLPTTLNGTQVFVGSQPVSLIYAGANQINAIIPRGLQPNTSYPLIVANGLSRSGTVMLSVAAEQPAIFTADASGSGQGVVAIVGDNVLAATTNGHPAQAGDYLTIYCNGLGPVAAVNGAAAPQDGTPTPIDNIFRTVGSVTVSFEGDDQPAQFAGLAPSMVDVYQVNVRVPTGHSGNSVPLVIKVTDQQTGKIYQSNTVTVALQ
ncbi:MAG TPA: glycoside hydrolase domain-containing protein [Bryobacteraceae bacterium]|nr:glycoside hydrolase domain-containing protein [Bryobacteraceae bacterium]